MTNIDQSEVANDEDKEKYSDQDDDDDEEGEVEVESEEKPSSEVGCISYNLMSIKIIFIYFKPSLPKSGEGEQPVRKRKPRKE